MNHPHRSSDIMVIDLVDSPPFPCCSTNNSSSSSNTSPLPPSAGAAAASRNHDQHQQHYESSSYKHDATIQSSSSSNSSSSRAGCPHAATASLSHSGGRAGGAGGAGRAGRGDDVDCTSISAARQQEPLTKRNAARNTPSNKKNSKNASRSSLLCQQQQQQQQQLPQPQQHEKENVATTATFPKTPTTTKTAAITTVTTTTTTTQSPFSPGILGSGKREFVLRGCDDCSPSSPLPPNKVPSLLSSPSTTNQEDRSTTSIQHHQEEEDLLQPPLLPQEPYFDADHGRIIDKEEDDKHNDDDTSFGSSVLNDDDDDDDGELPQAQAARASHSRLAAAPPVAIVHARMDASLECCSCQASHALYLMYPIIKTLDTWNEASKVLCSQCFDATHANANLMDHDEDNDDPLSKEDQDKEEECRRSDNEVFDNDNDSVCAATATATATATAMMIHDFGKASEGGKAASSRSLIQVPRPTATERSTSSFSSRRSSVPLMAPQSIPKPQAAAPTRKRRTNGTTCTTTTTTTTTTRLIHETSCDVQACLDLLQVVEDEMEVAALSLSDDCRMTLEASIRRELTSTSTSTSTTNNSDVVLVDDMILTMEKLETTITEELELHEELWQTHWDLLMDTANVLQQALDAAHGEGGEAAECDLLLAYYQWRAGHRPRQKDGEDEALPPQPPSWKVQADEALCRRDIAAGVGPGHFWGASSSSASSGGGPASTTITAKKADSQIEEEETDGDDDDAEEDDDPFRDHYVEELASLQESRFYTLFLPIRRGLGWNRAVPDGHPDGNNNCQDCWWNASSHEEAERLAYEEEADVFCIPQNENEDRALTEQEHYKAELRTLLVRVVVEEDEEHPPIQKVDSSSSSSFLLQPDTPVAPPKNKGCVRPPPQKKKQRISRRRNHNDHKEASVARTPVDTKKSSAPLSIEVEDDDDYSSEGEFYSKHQPVAEKCKTSPSPKSFNLASLVPTTGKRAPRRCLRCVQFGGSSPTHCRGSKARWGQKGCEYFTADGKKRACC